MTQQDHPPQQPLDELQALCAKLRDRADTAEEACRADGDNEVYAEAFALNRKAADTLEGQAQEIQRLREALCFYARENNWKSVTSYMCGHGAIHCSAMADKGNKARAALSQENKDDR